MSYVRRNVRQQLDELRREAAARLLQATWRSFKARLKWNIARTLRPRHVAACRVQACFRGARWRRDFEASGRADAAAMAALLVKLGMRKHVDWARRRRLSFAVLRDEVHHPQQLGGVLRLHAFGFLDPIFWGLHETKDRSKETGSDVRVRLVAAGEKLRAASREVTGSA
jgi:uncharacterized protein (DUF2267 family)